MSAIEHSRRWSLFPFHEPSEISMLELCTTPAITLSHNPMLSEMESLMGNWKGTTWTRTISNTDRHMIIGRATDAMDTMDAMDAMDAMDTMDASLLHVPDPILP